MANVASVPRIQICAILEDVAAILCVVGVCLTNDTIVVLKGAASIFLLGLRSC